MKKRRRGGEGGRGGREGGRVRYRGEGGVAKLSAEERRSEGMVEERVVDDAGR